MLPFDRDPGTAERFTELWAKAFGQVGPGLALLRCGCATRFLVLRRLFKCCAPLLQPCRS